MRIPEPAGRSNQGVPRGRAGAVAADPVSLEARVGAEVGGFSLDVPYKDLDPLRSHPQFQKLLTELEAKTQPEVK